MIISICHFALVYATNNPKSKDIQCDKEKLHIFTFEKPEVAIWTSLEFFCLQKCQLLYDQHTVVKISALFDPF